MTCRRIRMLEVSRWASGFPRQLPGSPASLGMCCQWSDSQSVLHIQSWRRLVWVLQDSHFLTKSTAICCYLLLVSFFWWVRSGHAWTALICALCQGLSPSCVAVFKASRFHRVPTGFKKWVKHVRSLWLHMFQWCSLAFWTFLDFEHMWETVGQAGAKAACVISENGQCKPQRSLHSLPA